MMEMYEEFLYDFWGTSKIAPFKFFVLLNFDIATLLSNKIRCPNIQTNMITSIVLFEGFLSL